ncbi:MAG: hypothetical protein ACRBC3_21070 [Burkholderiaceae bacterium]
MTLAMQYKHYGKFYTRHQAGSVLFSNRIFGCFFRSLGRLFRVATGVVPVSVNPGAVRVLTGYFPNCQLIGRTGTFSFSRLFFHLLAMLLADHRLKSFWLE